MTVYIVARKKQDQNESITTYLVHVLKNRSCTSSDGNEYGSQFVNLRPKIKKYKLVYRIRKGQLKQKKNTRHL